MRLAVRCTIAQAQQNLSYCVFPYVKKIVHTPVTQQTEAQMLNRLVRNVRAGRISGALLVVAGSALVASCDSLGIGCEGPEFTALTIEPVELNQQFTRLIRVRIDGSDDDEAFSYRFERTGELPSGVTARQDGQIQQNYLISGTPTELGTFPFQLSVRVNDGLDDSSCDSFVATNEFSLEVNIQGMGTGEVPPSG